MNINGQSVLVTGGTGSFGRAFVHAALTKYKPKKLIVFSRDELKQSEMAQQYKGHDPLRFFLGDVRDEKRLERAFDGVDIVIHAAALKQVPTLEYNPFEAIKTNVLGAENIINQAIERRVKKVVALSTDKAANPVNLYGATKLCAEKLFVAGNSYVGKSVTRFSVVRYGNVVGSRGSVIPFFLKKKESGVLPITDKRMTRFWITLNEAVGLVMKSLDRMRGGEIFVPKIPSVKVMDLAQAIAPKARLEFVGIRPGEKLHETLLTQEEATHSVEDKDLFVIEPEHPFWRQKNRLPARIKGDFSYTSDNNTVWLNSQQLSQMIKDVVATIDRRG